MTNAERQRAFRLSMEAKGFVQLTCWVPAHAAAEVSEACATMRKLPWLTVGRLLDPKSGRLVSTKG